MSAYNNRDEAINQAREWVMHIADKRGWSDEVIVLADGLVGQADEDSAPDWLTQARLASTVPGNWMLSQLGSALPSGIEEMQAGLAQAFWERFAALLLEKAPTPAPEGWDGLYAAAAAASGASADKIQQIIANKFSTIVVETVTESAQDLRDLGKEASEAPNKLVKPLGLLFLLLLAGKLL